MSHNWFRSVVVITSALHAEGPGFEPRRNLMFCWNICFTKTITCMSPSVKESFNTVNMVYVRVYMQRLNQINNTKFVILSHRFRSVVVITLASHARGPGFERRRNLYFNPKTTTKHKFFENHFEQQIQ